MRTSVPHKKQRRVGLGLKPEELEWWYARIASIIDRTHNARLKRKPLDAS